MADEVMTGVLTEESINDDSDMPAIVFTKGDKKHYIDGGFSIQDILKEKISSGLPWNSKDGKDIATQFGLTYPQLTSLRESDEWEEISKDYADSNKVELSLLGIKAPKKSRPRRNANFRITNPEVIGSIIGESFKGRTGAVVDVTNADAEKNPYDDITPDTERIKVELEISKPVKLSVDEMSRSELVELVKAKEKELVEAKNTSEELSSDA